MYMYAFIADIHLFTKLDKKDHLLSLEKLLSIIKENDEECYGIFVCGDLFDHRGNKDDLMFAAEYITRLVMNGCGYGCKRNAPVYFIHGTYSHDNEQYEIFLPVLNMLNDVEIHYIKHVTEGVTHAGHTVLFLPQEYGDVDYSGYLNNRKHYDLIVGHGPISSEHKSPCKSAGYEITHSVELLGEISELCVFGHYHNYTDFENGVYYIGANLRWQFGEEEPCVFFTCDNEFNVHTELNPYQIQYVTYDINSPEELRNHLSMESNDVRRFIIHVHTNEEMETYRGIISNNKKNKSIAFRIVSEMIDNDEENITPDIDLSNNKMSIDPVNSLITYITDKYHTDASSKVNEYASVINKDIESE